MTLTYIGESTRSRNTSQIFAKSRGFSVQQPGSRATVTHGTCQNGEHCLKEMHNQAIGKQIDSLMESLDVGRNGTGEADPEARNEKGP
jgi:hypothetical protein